MKIAFWHFYTFRLHRGIETLILSLSNELAQVGHDVSIVTAAAQREPLVKPLPTVKVHAFPVSRYFEHTVMVPFYVNHFLRHSYDHVVTFFSDFGEGAAERVISPLKKIPLSIYLCYPFSSVPHRYAAFKKYGWDQKAKHIFADARWIAEEAKTYFQKEIGIVPVGTDPERFKPDSEMRKKMRGRFGYAEGNIVLLNVSSLEKRKGTWRVLESLGRLKSRVPQLRFFVLGAGPEEPVMRRRVKDLKLEEFVYFGGETAALETYYNMADIFVMLPDSEGNSVACHEAMSCGLPVIASKSGGFEESVSCDAGILVCPHEDQDIDRAILELSNSPEKRSQMGSCARRNIQTRHSWTHTAEKMLSILNQ